MPKALKVPVDTSKMKVLSKNGGKDWTWRECLERKWEDADGVHETTIQEYRELNPDGSVHKRQQYRQKRTQRKFLCIGGKFEGTKQANPGREYYGFIVGDFNRSEKNAGNPRKTEITHRSVWIHASLLTEDKPKYAKKRVKGGTSLTELNRLAQSVRHSILDEDDADDAD